MAGETVTGSATNFGDGKTRLEDRIAEFLSAVQAGDLAKVESVIDQVDINAERSDRNRAVLLAAAYGHYQVAAFLVERGADLDCHGSMLRTPMHYFVSNGWADLVERGLQAGQDPLQGTSSKTPWSGLLATAVAYEHPDVVSVLMQRGGMSEDIRTNQLNIALHETRSASMVETLLDLGADVNSEGTVRRAPIFTAIVFSRLDVCETLIRGGADLECRYQDHTPLGWAASQGEISAMVLLLESGAKIEACGPGMTSLESVVADNTQSRAAYAAWKSKQVMQGIRCSKVPSK